MAKAKKMTNREKKVRTDFKKRMQEEGILPSDKQKLNRKKFVEDAVKEWCNREQDCLIWDIYMMNAISYILTQREGHSNRISLEAVGVAKLLKVAIRLHEFSDMLREKGEHEYKVSDQYDFVRDILDA